MLNQLKKTSFVWGQMRGITDGYCGQKKMMIQGKITSIFRFSPKYNTNVHLYYYWYHMQIPVIINIYWVLVVQLLSRVWIFVTPWTAACQASLSFTVSQNLLRFMSTELVMSSNHFVLCHPFSQNSPLWLVCLGWHCMA